MPGEATATTFSFETVAALVAALTEKGGTLGKKDYELMASLDGSRTASGFEHKFRSVKARAKELIAAKKGENGDGVTTPNGNGNGVPKKTKKTPASGTKRGRKGKSDEGNGDDDEASPTKKVKAEPKDGDEEAEQAFTAGQGSDGEN